MTLRILRTPLERAAIVAGGLFALWLLWCASTERSVDASGTIEARYGLLGWRLVEGDRQPPLERVIPWLAVGKVEVRPIATAATAVASAGVLLYAGLVAVRLEHNRRPRGICVHCGHRAREGSRRLVVCPECGAMPNARPSAFVP